MNIVILLAYRYKDIASLKAKFGSISSKFHTNNYGDGFYFIYLFIFLCVNKMLCKNFNRVFT